MLVHLAEKRAFSAFAGFFVSRLVIATCVSVVSSCGGESSSTKGPTDQQALHLIRQAEGYPALRSVRFGEFRETSPVGIEIKRLAAEGFLDGVAGKWEHYKASDKGKDYILSVEYNVVHNHYWIQMNVHRVDVTKIIDRQVDPTGKAATVIFEVATVKTPYFMKLESLVNKILDTNTAYYRDRFQETVSQHAGRFELWDNGWRLVSVDMKGY